MTRTRPARNTDERLDTVGQSRLQTTPPAGAFNAAAHAQYGHSLSQFSPTSNTPPIQRQPDGLGSQVVEGVKSTAPLVDLFGSALGEYSGMGNAMGGLAGMVGGTNDTVEGVSNIKESGLSNKLNSVSNTIGGLSGLGDSIPKALNTPGALSNATEKIGSFLSPITPTFVSNGMNTLGGGVSSLYNSLPEMPGKGYLSSGMSYLGSGLNYLGGGVSSLYNMLPEKKDIPLISRLPSLSDITGWLPTISASMKIVSGMTEAWNKSDTKNQAFALTKAMSGNPSSKEAANILYDEAWYTVLWAYGKSTAGVAELSAELFTAGTTKYGITVASKLYDSGLLGMAVNSNLLWLRQAVEMVVGRADKGKEARQNDLMGLVPGLVSGSRIADVVKLCKMADTLGMAGFRMAIETEFGKNVDPSRSQAFTRQNI